MKIGTIFEHTSPTGGIVRLKAVEEIDSMKNCSGCYFDMPGGGCAYPEYPCIQDENIFVETDEPITETKEATAEATAEATLSYTVDVTCPHCEHYFDIQDQLYQMEVDPWKEANTERNHEIDCPECGEEFEISINY